GRSDERQLPAVLLFWWSMAGGQLDIDGRFRDAARDRVTGARCRVDRLWHRGKISTAPSDTLAGRWAGLEGPLAVGAQDGGIPGAAHVLGREGLVQSRGKETASASGCSRRERSSLVCVQRRDAENCRLWCNRDGPCDRYGLGCALCHQGKAARSPAQAPDRSGCDWRVGGEALCRKASLESGTVGTVEIRTCLAYTKHHEESIEARRHRPRP